MNLILIHALARIHWTNMSFAFSNSVRHEYNDWDDKNPRLLTCNPSTRLTPNAHRPQEVADDTNVVFTYDVTFQVFTHFFKLAFFDKMWC